MYVFYCIFMPFRVLDFGLDHSGSRPYYYITTLEQWALSSFQYRIYVNVQIFKEYWPLKYTDQPSQSSIRESVDSLCRDGLDAQYMQKPYNFSTNTLNAYLSTQHSSSMISKARIIAQKPHGRQLNAKVCGSESAMCKYTKPYPYIFLHYSCTLVWKRCRDGVLYIYHHFYTKPHLVCIQCTFWRAIPTFQMFSTFLCVLNCR